MVDNGSAAEEEDEAIPRVSGSGWDHVTRGVSSIGKIQWTCNYCHKSFAGANITKVRKRYIRSWWLRRL